jgi:Flp pilus assembly protein TadD
MKKSVGFKIAVSPLVLGITMVGCSTTSQNALFQPVGQSAKEARADLGASKSFEMAQLASQKGDFVQALAHAERAVELSPRDAGYRMLLGDAYLKNGRFVSAEMAFSDVLALHPDNSRARFSLALAEIALGKNYLALVQLDRLSQTEAASDLGLAYAMAGQPDRAVAMLEPAAREANANGRVRQNLALAYAMSGDWQRARITAGQDLSPADLGARMEQWASFTHPQASHDQIASLLGVKAIDDAGQPTRLALAAEAPQPVALAAAEAPAQPAPVAPAAVEFAAVEAPAPVPAALEAPAPVAVPRTQAVRYAEAVRQTLLTPQSAVIKSTPVHVKIATFAPAKPKVLARPVSEAPAAIGNYVVQLGAYGSARLVEKAWATVQQRYDLGDHAPLTARVTLPKGTFHRLSVAGFTSQADASLTCRTIKGKGGACFVRPVSGDAPIRFASRDTRAG